MPDTYTSGEGDYSDIGNWNNARAYSLEVIMDHIRLIRRYQKIAKFGFVDFFDQVNNQGYLDIDELKLNGFERFVYELLQLIENSKMAIKREKTDKKILECQGKLKQVIKFWKRYFKKTKDISGKEHISLVDDYYKAFEFCIVIKEEILDCLNKNDLIYNNFEKFDPEKAREEIFKDATELG